MSSFDRVEGESERAFAAFTAYCRMGPGRSLARLLERYQSGPGAALEIPPTRRLTTLKEWSRAYRWQARAAAFDDEQEQADLELWQERRKAIRESDWQTGQRLRALVDQMLERAPDFIKVTRRQVIPGEPTQIGPRGELLKQGTPDREIVTLAFDLRSVLRAFEVASKAERLAAGMPDSAVEISTPPGEFSAAELATLTAELEAWERERFGPSNGAVL